MQQFIQMATSALGTSEQVVRTATGSILDVVAKNAPPADVSALLNRIPGATDLLNAFRAAPPPAPPPPPPEPGILGTVKGAASAAIGAGLNAGSTVLGTGASVLGAGSSALGAGATGLHSLASIVQESGLDPTKAPQLLGMFAQYAAQHAGPELVQRVLGSVPGISGLLNTLGTFGLPGMPGKK